MSADSVISTPELWESLGNSSHDHEFNALGIRVRVPVHSEPNISKQLVKYHEDTPDGKKWGRATKEFDEALKRHSDTRFFPPTKIMVFWNKDWPELPADETALSTGSKLKGSSDTQLANRPMTARTLKTAKDFPKTLKSQFTTTKFVSAKMQRHVMKATLQAQETIHPPINAGSLPLAPKQRPNTARSASALTFDKSEHLMSWGTPAPGHYTIKDSRHIRGFLMSGPAREKAVGAKTSDSLRTGPGSYNLNDNAIAPHVPVATMGRAKSRFQPVRSSTPGPGHYTAHIPHKPKGGVSFSGGTFRGGPADKLRAPPQATLVLDDADSKITRSRLPHRFSASPRFQEYGDEAQRREARAAHTLAVNDAKSRARSSRSRKLTKSARQPGQETLLSKAKQQVRAYEVSRRTKLLKQRKIQREQRQMAAHQHRQQQRLEHLDKMDRVLNKEQYTLLETQRREEREAKIKFDSGWLFHTAMYSRVNVWQTQLREIRRERNLELLKQMAAHTLQRFGRRWLQTMRERKRVRAGLIILRAMQRNVAIRRRQRRKWASATILHLRLATTTVTKMQLMGRLTKQRVITLQRAWRRYFNNREFALILLTMQWDKYEQILARKVAADDLKKRQKSKKEMKEIEPFPFVTNAMKREVILMDYKARRIAFGTEYMEYLLACDDVAKLEQLTRTLSEAQEQSADTEEVLALSADAPLPKKPIFHVLPAPHQLFALMQLAHGRMNKLQISAAMKAKLAKTITVLKKKKNLLV